LGETNGKSSSVVINRKLLGTEFLIAGHPTRNLLFSRHSAAETLPKKPFVCELSDASIAHPNSLGLNPTINKNVGAEL
jgi:hypothetical protein